MPQVIDREGTFRFQVMDHAVNVTKTNNFPQLVMRLRATEYWDAENSEWVPWAEYEMETTAFLILFFKDDTEELVAARNVEQCQLALGWDGQSLSGLNDLDLTGKVVQGRVATNEYKGKVSLRVEWIDVFDAEPGMGSCRRLDAKTLSDLDKQFKGLLGGGKAPAKAPAKAKAKKVKAPPKATPVPPTSATDDDAGEPEPVDELAEPSTTTDAPLTADDVMSIVDKQTAWDYCLENARDGVNDDMVVAAFVEQMKEQGDDEATFTIADWRTIAANVLDAEGICDIPF